MTIRLWRVRLDLLGVAGLLFALLVWWAAARALGPLRLPAPEHVAPRVVSYMQRSVEIEVQGGGRQGLRPHLIYSVQQTLVGVTIGSLLGILVGLAMGWSPRLAALLTPSIEALRTVPPLAALPFFILWFGPSVQSQLGMLIFYCFLILVINTVSAIRNVSPIYHQFALTQGATRGQIFRTVVLPAIMPELTGAIRVAIGISFGIQIVTELLGAKQGVGQIFSMALSLQALDLIMVGIIWLAIAAVVTDLLFTRLAHYLTRWAPRVS